MVELGADGPRLRHAVHMPGDGVVVIRLEGELDIASTDQLDAEVRDVIEKASTALVVDVGGLGFADSSAIALWVSWGRQVPKLEIRNPRPIIRRVIETMGLAQTLNPT